jgi:ABC-type multidrug transport system fused ATPase/permease subunit
VRDPEVIALTYTDAC